MGQVAASMIGPFCASLAYLIFCLDSCSRSALFFDLSCIANASLLSNGLKSLGDLILVELIEDVICFVI